MRFGELEGFRELLESYGREVAELYKRKLQAARSSGALIASVKPGIRTGGGEYSVYLTINSYGLNVEHGRRPGKFPPPDAIRVWIEQKPIVPQPDSGGRIPSINQLTFLIGRHIAEHGIEARPFLQQSIAETFDSFAERLDAILVDNFYNLVRQTF